MKIVEALKRLRVIEKRMMDNCQDITRYASMVSTERPLFESEEKQRIEVKGLIQANQDLLKEFLTLKRNIDYSNLEITVEISGVKYTLADLLIIKRKLAAIMMQTYNSLNDSAGQRRLTHSQIIDGKAPHIVRFFNEENKNKGLRHWQDLYHEIDSRLEVINATTNLLIKED